MGDPSLKTPKRILIVDDHQDTLSFMQVALERAGYEVQITSMGEQALALQRERPADLLIADVFMPGQDGIETLWHFKDYFPQTRTIVMSAGGGSNGKQDYFSTAEFIGVNATLRKPFTVDQLLDAVRTALQPR